MSLEGSVVSERPITAIAISHQMIVQYKVRGEGWDISNLYDSSWCAKQSKDKELKMFVFFFFFFFFFEFRFIVPAKATRHATSGHGYMHGKVP